MNNRLIIAIVIIIILGITWYVYRERTKGKYGHPFYYRYGRYYHPLKRYKLYSYIHGPHPNRYEYPNYYPYEKYAYSYYFPSHSYGRRYHDRWTRRGWSKN